MTAVVAEPVSAGRSRFYDVPVAHVDRVCEDAVAITFDVPSELLESFRFRPGQSVTVRRPGGADERRSYSVCARIGQPMRIGVRRVADGQVSTWLVDELRPGDLVQLQPPSGTFTPDLGVPGRHVLIAAGSGITPSLSIAGSVALDARSEVVLVYGNRRAGTVMFADEVADLKDRSPGRVQVAHVLSREPQEVELFNGRLDADKLRTLLPVLCSVDSVDHWWLCGPYGMVVDAAALLAEWGVPPARVHRELFYVEPDPPAPAEHREGAVTGTEVTVMLDGRATTVTVPAGVPILDGAQRQRPDLPFACKGGVCGTCRAKIVSGRVTMRRNFALEDDEVQDGFVLTCQALPETPDVTVDFDA